MNDPWTTTEVLITVRTYPVPSRQSIEVSCTAGVTRDFRWIRLYPIPWRLLPAAQQFRKYQWIRVSVRQATSDPRPESRRVKDASVEIVSGILPTAGQWAQRRLIVLPLKDSSMCALRAEQKATGAPTLGFIKPRKVRRLRIDAEKNPDWSEAQLARLRQQDMLRTAPANELEKIPFKFSYEFICEEAACRGHTMMCADWEMAARYRAEREHPHWRERFLTHFQRITDETDLHFYVGTVSDHPYSWIITGLWYPPLEQQGLLL